MAGLVRVRTRVPVGRVVAATHLAALQTDAQVQPQTAAGQAVLTARDRLGQLCDLDVVEMTAGGHGL